MAVPNFQQLLQTRKFLTHLAAFILVVFLATMFYVLFEGWDALTSFYFVVSLMTLVGANNTPKTPEGLIFAGLLELASVGIIISLIAQVFGPYLAVQVLSQHRLRKASKLQGHLIIAGDSATTRELLHTFDKKSTLVVVREEEAYNAISNMGYPTLKGDPASSQLLQEAGIQDCKAVIAAFDDDADNAFVCLTVKRIRKEVKVIAKITTEENRDKMAAAGADFIVCPPTLAINEITKAAFS